MVSHIVTIGVTLGGPNKGVPFGCNSEQRLLSGSAHYACNAYLETPVTKKKKIPGYSVQKITKNTS